MGKRVHTCGDAFSLHVGDWDTAGKRDAARPAAEDEEDEDAFGEFEDLETGVCTLLCCCVACVCLCLCLCMCLCLRLCLPVPVPVPIKLRCIVHIRVD